jgi:hypothetical protein
MSDIQRWTWDGVLRYSDIDDEYVTYADHVAAVADALAAAVQRVEALFEPLAAGEQPWSDCDEALPDIIAAIKALRA